MKSKVFLFAILFVSLFYVNFFALDSESFQDKKEQEFLQHEVKVNLVLIDVIVTKNGKFVRDLKIDDFELYEDGKKVPINSSDLISFAERNVTNLKEKLGGEIFPSTPSKKIVVVVDGVNSRSRHVSRGVKKIFGELVSLVKLGHEVMIIQLNTNKGVEILLPFTTEEEFINGTIEKVAGDIWIDKSLDSLRMAQEVETKGIGDQAQGQRKIGKSAQITALSQEYGLFKKRRFEITARGLLAVINMIKNLPGRKSIMLISDGIPSVSREGLGSVEVFDPLNVFKKNKSVNSDDIIRELIRYANAQNISIYSLDLGAFTEYFFTASVESDLMVLNREKQERLDGVQNLEWISEDTGAAWLRGAKKYDGFRKVMKTDLNYYYQLSYSPPRKKPDNKYHQIKVKVKRSGVNTRYRKGYTDYSEEEEEKVLLLSAFYNPGLFKELPFEAEFIPFHENSNRYKSWMSIALPVKELFAERELAYGSKVFNLHFWVMDKKGKENIYQGKMDIPLNIDSTFMDVIRATDYFCFHFTGPEVECRQKEYQVVFALYDGQTKEIGTSEQSLVLPDFKKNQQGTIINCVLGSLASNPEGGEESFALSKQGGSLKCGHLEFFPAVTNRFNEMQEVSVFLQAYLPKGKDKSSPVFTILKEGLACNNIPGEMVAEILNEESKVWSGIFNLYLKGVSSGDYLLKVTLFLSEEDPILSKDVKIIILDY